MPVNRSVARMLIPSSFATAKVSQAYLARYYLRSMGNAYRGEDDAAYMQITEDEKVLNLEHVLPQNPKKGAWKGISQELHASLYTRLGNLALLLQKINSEVSNGPFLDKREHYEKCPLPLTSEIGRQSTWGEKQIKERQEELAKLALKTWPLRPKGL